MYWINDKKQEFLSSLLTDMNITRVVFEDLRVSEGTLLSRDYGDCHTLVFLDKMRAYGILSHLDITTPPSEILGGYANGQNPHNVVKPQDIYSKPESVSVLHLYHETYNKLPDSEFTEEGIEDILNDYGFKNVRHIKLYPTGSGFHLARRDIALATKEGVAYVFPDRADDYLVIPIFDGIE